MPANRWLPTNKRKPYVIASRKFLEYKKIERTLPFRRIAADVLTERSNTIGLTNSAQFLAYLMAGKKPDRAACI